MNENLMSSRELIAAAGAIGCMALGAASARAAAKADLTAVESNFSFPHKGETAFELRGEHPTFGRYSSFGEVVDMKNGDALGVLTDQDGDRIVGAVAFNPEADHTTSFRFSWRQSIQLSNGRKYVNTGKFADHVPAGLVVLDLSNFIAAVIETARRLLPKKE